MESNSFMSLWQHSNSVQLKVLPILRKLLICIEAVLCLNNRYVHYMKFSLSISSPVLSVFTSTNKQTACKQIFPFNIELAAWSHCAKF